MALCLTQNPLPPSGLVHSGMPLPSITGSGIDFSSFQEKSLVVEPVALEDLLRFSANHDREHYSVLVSIEAEQLQSDLEKPARLLQRRVNVVKVDKSGCESAQISELQEYDADSKIVSTAEAASMEKRTQSATSRLLLNRLGQAQEQPLSFMIVTRERSSPCKTAIGSNIMMKTYKNKVDYCNLHGCKVWYALEVWEKGFTGTWVRYPLLLRLMKANPSITWFMWMDSDAIFTDLNFSIPFDTYNGWNKNFVVSGFWEKVYAKEPDWMALNARVFLIRNCEWSYTFLQNWRALGAPENIVKAKEAMNSVIKSRPQDWDPDDQSALVYLLNQNRKESEVKTFLEAGYSLHGYSDYIVDKYEDIMQQKEKWPFVTHFCGCNFCGGMAMAISDRCAQGFERAFNFADNLIVTRLMTGVCPFCTARFYSVQIHESNIIT